LHRESESIMEVPNWCLILLWVTDGLYVVWHLKLKRFAKLRLLYWKIIL
jgi:hypothetical protein